MIDALLEDKQGLSIGRLIDPICIMYLGLVLHDRITLLDLYPSGYHLVVQFTAVLCTFQVHSPLRRFGSTLATHGHFH